MSVREVFSRFGNYSTYHSEGFSYHYANSSGKNVNLKCSLVKRPQSCAGKAWMALQKEDRTIIVITRPHNHAPNNLLEETTRLRNGILDRCVAEATKISVIYREECEKVPIHVAATTSYNSMRTSMFRARKTGLPPTPTTLAELGPIIEDPRYCQRFQLTQDGGLFFRGIVGDGGNLEGHSAIFVSPGLMHTLAVTSEIHMDGTFKVVPNVPRISQLFTIMSIRFDHAFPVVSVLMERQTTEAYVSVLNFVKTLMPTMLPKYIITDYEAALQRAIIECFPGAELHGCWYHFADALCRKTRVMGLIRLFEQSPEAGKVVRMCIALALLHPSSILQGYNDIVAYAHEKDVIEHLQPFLTYFEDTWIKRIGPNIFSVNGIPRRTNNDQESHHRCLFTLIGLHPSLFIFLGHLMSMDRKKTQEYLSLEASLPVHRPRANRYVLQDNRVVNSNTLLLARRYGLRDFLETTSYCAASVFNHQIIVIGRDFAAADEEPAAIGLVEGEHPALPNTPLPLNPLQQQPQAPITPPPFIPIQQHPQPPTTPPLLNPLQQHPPLAIQQPRQNVRGRGRPRGPGRPIGPRRPRGRPPGRGNIRRGVASRRGLGRPPGRGRGLGRAGPLVPEPAELHEVFNDGETLENGDESLAVQRQQIPYNQILEIERGRIARNNDDDEVLYQYPGDDEVIYQNSGDEADQGGDFQVLPAPVVEYVPIPEDEVIFVRHNERHVAWGEVRLVPGRWQDVREDPLRFTKVYNEDVLIQESEIRRLLSLDGRLEEPVEADDIHTTCKVCCINRATRSIVPCGHTVLCIDCVQYYASHRRMFDGEMQPQVCPQCRCMVARYLRAFGTGGFDLN